MVDVSTHVVNVHEDNDDNGSADDADKLDRHSKLYVNMEVSKTEKEAATIYTLAKFGLIDRYVVVFMAICLRKTGLP